ncbi:MAG TPA: ABC transporter permease subunit [Candidatus Sulfotelmatobacter sp.]|nr:ABC transporter permease subunit [Candidatus Sulfotelmatobacter sp.]
MTGAGGRRAVIAVPYLWLVAMLMMPFLIVLKISFATSVIANPPYTPLIGDGRLQLHLDSYALLASDDLYALAYLNSLKIAALACLCCLVIGYPMAYGIARASPARRGALLMLVILPFWTSFLIRVYAWVTLLQSNGPVNGALLALGVIDHPLVLLNTPFAVYVGIVYTYLPFMILPLYAVLEKLDPALLEAAADLGSRPWRSFLSVTLPLSLPGVIAGSLLVFIPAVGEFVIPELLGGSDTLMIGSVLWNEFFNNRDWPQASVVAVAMLVLLVAPIMLFQHYRADAAPRSVH